MKSLFHQNAIENFNKRANQLISYLSESNCFEHGKENFKSEQPIKHVITSEIAEISISSKIDDFGRITERSLINNGKKLILDANGCETLDKISEQIQNLSALKNKVSKKYISNLIWDWIEQTKKSDNFNENFITYLEKNITNDVKEYLCIIPISNLEVEVSFPIANSVITPLSKEKYNSWIENLDCSDGVPEHLNNLRERHQGLASVVTKVNAEPRHAKDLALKEAKLATMVLSFFQKEQFILQLKAYRFQ